MANPDSVAQYYLDAFGNGRIAVVQATALNTAGLAKSMMFCVRASPL